MVRKILALLLVSLAVGMACLATCTLVYGSARANVPAFLTIYSYWMLVTIALGSQILLNFRSGRAHGQLDPHVFISNWLENAGWILFSWTSGDPVYLISRFAGLWFDQIVFWQILVSQTTGSLRKRLPRFLLFAAPPFVGSLGVLFGPPLLFSDHVQQPGIHTTVSSLVLIVWLYVVVSWVQQFQRNRAVGVLSGRDFSLLIPLLIEIFLLFALLNEFLSGAFRFVPLVTMGISFAVNTALLIQSQLHYRAWHRLTPDEQAHIVGLHTR